MEQTERTRKLAHLIQHEIAPLLLEEVDARKFGILTITRVEVAPDLGIARVWVSCFQNQKHLEEKLFHLAYRLQKTLNKKLKLKKLPRLQFKLDQTGTEAGRLERLIEEENRKLR